MITLGIETSCDETGCGIVDQDLTVLSNKIFSQVKEHEAYGGVVPEIAARAHLEKVSPIVDSALNEAGLRARDVDLIAFTRGPGLVGPLLVGASFAAGMGRVLNKPVVGLSHLEGHLAAAHLSDRNLSPPFICLTVSGGHTELCLVEREFSYSVLGCTRDDAVGEAFDKCGKVLGLGYPAGPLVSQQAAAGRADFVKFPQAMDIKGNYEFSFSGLKTAFLRYLQSKDDGEIKRDLPHICASLESALVDILVKKTFRAMKELKISTAAVCGGVSANGYLRRRMAEEAEKRGFKVVIPHISLCTDNGAMIAGIAQMRANMDSLPLESEVTPSLGWPK